MTMVKHAGEDDPYALRQLDELADWLVRFGVPIAMKQCHDRGYSWDEIAIGMGTKRQSAHERATRRHEE
jgi:hypothetical protein